MYVTKRTGKEILRQSAFISYRFANVTNIPSFGLVISSQHVWSSSIVCVEVMEKLCKTYDRTIFTSRKANRWPEKTNKQNKTISEKQFLY